MIKQMRLLEYVKIFIIVMAIVIVFIPDQVQALNAQGNKAANFLGYAYVDSNNLKIFIDKGNAYLVPGQIKIFKGKGVDGERVAIEKTIADGEIDISGTNDTTSPKYLKVTSTLVRTAEAFQPGQVYTVLISSTVKGNNSITIGGFYFNHDSKFYFEAPDAEGKYSQPVVIASRPENGAAMVPWEGNLGFTVSQAVYNYEEVKAGIILQKNGMVLTPGTETYLPVVNYSHTSFFLPMTGSGGSTSYNLSADSDYKLVIPTLKGSAGEVLMAEQTIAFHTTTVDLPSGSANPVRITAAGDTLSFEWDLLSEAASYNITGYNLYVSQDPYWDFEKINAVPIAGNTYSIKYSEAGLSASKSYYFRYTAVNEGGETGYSPYASTDADVPIWADQSSVTISKIEKNSMLLKWPAATDNSGAVDAYRIYRDGKLLESVSGTTLTYTANDLSPNRQYTFKIEAGDVAGNWTTNGPAVSGLTALPLVWDAAADNVAVAKYKIFQDGNLLAELAGNTTSYNVCALSPGINYTFRVEAGDAIGNWSTNGPSLTIKAADPDQNIIATPVATPSAGTLAAGTSVKLTTTSTDATIYYTLDGTEPTTESTQYTKPIIINETVTIKAIAAGAGAAKSEVMTASYTIQNNPGTNHEGSYKVVPTADPAYLNGTTAYGINTFTINSGYAGNQCFAVSVTPVAAHQGTENAVFVWLRDGIAQGMKVVEADFDTVGTASANFDVQPGDMVKVYIVDDLVMSTEWNATVLEE